QVRRGDMWPLFRRRWHSRGMVIDNQPMLAILHVGEAVTRWQALGLAVLDVRKRVVTGVDRHSSINADQLVAEGDFSARDYLQGGNKVGPQRRSVGAHRWR